MLIGIFGGTFDPIHNGHLNLAENLLDKTEVDKVLFIPAANPPHKPQKPISLFVQRYNMVRLAIENRPGFLITDIENRTQGFSYTVKTVKSLKKLYPEDDFTLIIGEDSLSQLHTWYKSEELIRECSVTSYPRPGYKVSLEYLQEYWSVENAEKLYKRIVDMPEMDLAATNIRSNFYIDEKVRDFIPEKVMQYILENKLYC